MDSSSTYHSPPLASLPARGTSLGGLLGAREAFTARRHTHGTWAARPAETLTATDAILATLLLWRRKVIPGEHKVQQASQANSESSATDERPGLEKIGRKSLIFGKFAEFKSLHFFLGYHKVDVQGVVQVVHDARAAMYMHADEPGPLVER